MRPILDHWLWEPAGQVFQDAVMAVEPAMHLGVAGQDDVLLTEEFTLDLEQQVPLTLFPFQLFLLLSVTPDQTGHNSRQQPQRPLPAPTPKSPAHRWF